MCVKGGGGTRKMNKKEQRGEGGQKLEVLSEHPF